MNMTAIKNRTAAIITDWRSYRVIFIACLVVVAIVGVMSALELGERISKLETRPFSIRADLAELKVLAAQVKDIDTRLTKIEVDMEQLTVNLERIKVLVLDYVKAQEAAKKQTVKRVKKSAPKVGA